MTAQDWLGTILTALSILALVAGGIKWLVKHYLSELKPNSGSSMKDSLTRVEQKTDKMFDLLIDHLKNHP